MCWFVLEDLEYSHEIIVPYDDIPFKMFVFEGKDGNYVRRKHWHRSIEIFALFEGELEFYLNDVRHLLKPGEFMLVNSNEIHSILSPKANQTIVLQIPLSTFERYYTNDRFIYFYHSSRLQDEEVMRLIEDMYWTYVEKKCGYELKVQSQFYMLIYLLVNLRKYLRRNTGCCRASIEEGTGEIEKGTGVFAKTPVPNLKKR